MHHRPPQCLPLQTHPLLSSSSSHKKEGTQKECRPLTDLANQGSTNATTTSIYVPAALAVSGAVAVDHHPTCSNSQIMTSSPTPTGFPTGPTVMAFTVMPSRAAMDHHPSFLLLRWCTPSISNPRTGSLSTTSTIPHLLCGTPSRMLPPPETMSAAAARSLIIHPTKSLVPRGRGQPRWHPHPLPCAG